MKSFLASLLSGLLLLSLGSCTKEYSYEPSSQDSSSANGNFYATIDGKLWKGDSIQQAILADGTLTITGIGKTRDAMAIVLPGILPGVYALSVQSPGYALFADLQDSTDPYLSNASQDASKAGGTVTLTSVDTARKTVSGTFQFNLYQASGAVTMKVTSGVFTDIPYYSDGSSPVNPGGPPSGGGSGGEDTLTASINGVDWEAAVVNSATQAGVLGMIGSDASIKQGINLYMPSNAAPGTYSMDFNSSAGYYGAYIADLQSTNPVPLLPLQDNDGSLTILENDTVNRRIRGNFQFNAESADFSKTVSITNGYFSIGY
jgi:hypothetical protein